MSHESMGRGSVSRGSGCESGRRFSGFRMADVAKLGISTDCEFGGSPRNDFCFSTSF